MTSQSGTVLCQYHYDPLDRLVSHALPNIPERQRFYCKSRLATEIQGAVRFSIVQHGDQLLAQQRSEGDAPDTTLLTTDQQRSVLQTVKANYPQQTIAYSPYGHRSAETGLLSLLGFNGERPDPVTGCYVLGNGYRAFNPILMRFNSPDSLSPFGNGGLNAHAYCLGDPINRSDPTGYFSIKIVSAIKAWQVRAKNNLTMKANHLSGPETLYTYDTIKSTHTLYPGGTWKEIVKTKNTAGETMARSQAVGADGYVTVINRGGPFRYYKATPNLQELCYSRLPGDALKRLPNNPSYQQTTMDIDKFNFDIASFEINHQLTALNPSLTDTSSLEIAKNMGANGMLMGVHPDKIKNIRKL